MVCVAILPHPAAAQGTLSWDAVSTPDLARYRVHWDVESGGGSDFLYAHSQDVGNTLSVPISTLTPALEDRNTYFIVVTAIDVAGNESGFSNEVNFSAAPVAPPGTATLKKNQPTITAPIDQPNLTGTIRQIKHSVKSSGHRVIVKLDIRNEGTAIAIAPFSVTFFLSDDDVLDGNDDQVQTVVLGNDLAPGETSGLIKLKATGRPASVIGRTALVVITANNESQDDTHTLAGLIEEQPDLVGTIMSVKRVVKSAGNKVVVKFNIRNQGTATATEPFSVTLFLSDDDVLDAADEQLATVSIADRLVPGAATAIIKLKETGLRPIGGKFIIIMVDDANHVAESNESNNTDTRLVGDED